MSFDQSQIEEFRSAVARVARTSIPPFQREQFYGTVPRQLFEAFAETGVTALAIDEQFGGLAAPPSLAAAVYEEIAALDLGPAIFLSVHGMVAGILQRHGNEAQRSKYLPQLAAGSLLGAFALTEPNAGSDAAALRCTAQKTDTGYLLTGEKCYITSAGFADLYVTFARLNPKSSGKESVTAFLIDPKEVDGTTFVIGKPEKKMGCELSPIATLTFDRLALPSSARLGEEGKGFAAALTGLAGGRVNIGACANGISRTAVELATRHLKERSQFDQKLIEFQGLQFMLADMKTKLTAAQLLVREAAERISSDAQGRATRLYASMAKCFATDTAMQITTDAVQLLGGAGYLREYQVERLMREAKMLQIVEGTNQIQRVLIAREMITE